MFRFSIRELLILTLTAGLAVGWWLDHRVVVGRVKLWQSRAGLWESRAERIVDLLRTDGWKTSWNETPKNHSVTMKLSNGGVKYLSRGR
jgi:hypothetical protein